MKKVKQILANNWLSFLCAVIAIAAVAGSTWPLGGYFTALQGQVDQRAAVYNTLNGLRTKARNLPSVDPTNATPVPLTKFPSKEIIARGLEVKTQVEKESQAMLESAIELNRHDLLVPGSLPLPSPVQAVTYRDQYASGVENLKAILNAGMLPSQADITQKTAELKAELDKTLAFNSTTGVAYNQAAVDAEFQARSLELPGQLAQQAANEHTVYLSPDSLTVNRNINPAGPPPDPLFIWWSQLELWVQEDVCKAVHDVNAGSPNVMKSPIKHVVKLEVLDQFLLRQGDPYVPTGDPAAAINKSYNASPTGRVSNPFYDVVPFRLVLNVETTKIPQVLEEISRGRFINVVQMDVSSLDSAERANADYFYGSESVATISMRCEALLLRKWTDPYIPLAVKQKLSPPPGAAPDQPAADAPQ